MAKTFSYWPSFHDAEVLEITLWRGDVEPERQSYVFPVLTAKIHLWELTSELNREGSSVLRQHTMATLRFHDVDELNLKGFNHQNAIFGLSIVRKEREQGASPVFAIEFEPAFGVAAEFICMRVEVVEAVPCDQFGR